MRRIIPLLVALAVMLTCAAPSFAQRALEPGASVGFGEGSSAGNVDLELNGGRAIVFGLTLNSVTGRYEGVGTFDYNAQGAQVFDERARFTVSGWIASPTRDVPDCSRVARFPESISITGAGGYLLSTGPIQFDRSTPCARATYFATILTGSALGRTRHKPQPATALRWQQRYSVTGRLIAP